MDTVRIRRTAAAGSLLVAAVLASGCDVVIGPPPQDVDGSAAVALPH